MAAAVRRLALLLAILFVGTILGSLLLGWLLGAHTQRSVSLGLDVVGAFLLVIGFFVGIRGPLRLGGSDTPGSADRFVRFAQPDERLETINLSALFVSMGFVLIVVGLALDPRYRLL